MKVMKTITKKCAGFLAAVMVILAGVWTAAVPAEAASGNVYTCAVHPCYVHPVTGVIEDSGGEASYATGQGMVDGVVYPTGILELTDSGEYYLTVRFSLMDQTSGHSFWVQNVGDSGWSAPAAGVTGSGTDGNGTTADICIQVPSENCVVRVSMYVDPMGRDTAGNSTDMNATIVTASSGSGEATADSTASGSGSAGAASAGSGISGLPGASVQSGQGSSASGSSDTEAGDSSTEAPALSSSIDKAAQPTASTDTELNDAQGLSLSTGADASEEAEETGSSGGSSAFAIGAAVTVSGLILMGTAAVIVYFFRKNWKRWGGGYDDDEA